MGDMALKIPTHTIYGRLVPVNERRSALVFHPHNVKERAAPAEFHPIYLRYALTLMGTERPFFPSFILDDWGQEIKKLKMYKWLHIEGDRFPRAEIFGYVYNVQNEWEKTQYFARDLELSARYPVYAYEDKAQDLAEGVILSAIISTHDDQSEWASGQARPFKTPLGRSRVRWWQMPLHEALQPDIDISPLGLND